MLNIGDRLVSRLSAALLPGIPLCPCGNPAELTDDGADLCTVCLLRRAHLAAKPSAFEVQVIAGAATEHADVVEIVSAMTDAHTHEVPGGFVVHGRQQLTWRWRATWPEDDRTLEDLLETAGLERLWSRS